MNNLSQNLKLLRKQNKMNQQQVADYLNISQQAYGRYEKGDREPDVENLIRLSKLFRVSLDYLIGYYMTPPNGQQINQIAIGNTINQRIN